MRLLNPDHTLRDLEVEFERHVTMVKRRITRSSRALRRAQHADSVMTIEVRDWRGSRCMPGELHRDSRHLAKED